MTANELTITKYLVQRQHADINLNDLFYSLTNFSAPFLLNKIKNSTGSYIKLNIHEALELLKLANGIYDNTIFIATQNSSSDTKTTVRIDDHLYNKIQNLSAMIDKISSKNRYKNILQNIFNRLALTDISYNDRIVLFEDFLNNYRAYLKEEQDRLDSSRIDDIFKTIVNLDRSSETDAVATGSKLATASPPPPPTLAMPSMSSEIDKKILREQSEQGTETTIPSTATAKAINVDSEQSKNYYSSPPPPPPPPPPSSLAFNDATIASTIKKDIAAAPDESFDIVSAIKQGIKLKPVDKDQQHVDYGSNRHQLFDQLTSFEKSKLKKVPKSTLENKKFGGNVKSPVMLALDKIMNAKKFSSTDISSEEQSSADEWEVAQVTSTIPSVI